MSNSRRKFLQRTAAVVAGVAAAPLAAAATLTPRQPAGPFYPAELPLDDDNDLTRVQGRTDTARGTVSDLTGRLLDASGNALDGIRIEIWQCDANGRYRHPRDTGRAAIDPAFQGFGHTRTDADGRYRFRTIRPMPYPGRTPHIHVAVRPPGVEPFVTQLYVAGDPRNADDFLFRRIPVEQRPLVTAAFVPGEGTAGPLQASWDIVLGVARG